MSSLTIGHISYLNCVPFFAHLREQGFSGQIVSGVPSALNRMLQQGEVDASPSSSFEYASNWLEYLVLPGHSISSCGKVDSVLLFSKYPLADLENQPIAITGESATSINLLRVILREFVGLRQVQDAVPDGPVEDLINKGQPALLIGDRAMKVASRCSAEYIYDLGELWYRYTNLPFVFALWMVRKTAVSKYPKELALLPLQLQASVEETLENPDALAIQAAKQIGFTKEKICDYWRTIDYRLTGAHLRGLQLFFSLCVKYQLLAQEPEIHFWPQ